MVSSGGGVKVGGPGQGQFLGRGQGLGVKIRVKVVGQGQGHDRWSQCRGSRSVVKIRV